MSCGGDSEGVSELWGLVRGLVRGSEGFSEGLVK